MCNNLNLTKCLRQALVLFTLLLLPSAAWGQITVVDVGPLVSGTVTREGIITGTVTYDAYNNILTLEDADITYGGSIIIVESSNKLTIDIKGNNKIKTTSSDPVITRTGDASPEIEFTSSTNTGSLILEYAGGDSNQRLLELITPSGLAPKFLAPETANDWSSATKAEIKALGLTVAGVTATTGNCTDILTGDNKGKVSFTPAEGSDPATLTLAGVNIGPSSAGIVWSGFYPLKIKYSGNNIINTRTESVVNEEDGYCIFYNGSNTGSPVLSLSASDDASTLVLKPSNGESNSRAAITRFSVNCNGWGMYYSDDCSQVTDATDLIAGKEVIISKGQPLGLSVAGVPVTSANKDDVLNDGGTVKFTPANDSSQPATPAILTLNGAVLTAPIIIGLSELTIDIQGTNSITTNTTCIQNQENTTPVQLTFKSTSAEVGSLTLTNTGDNSNGVINDKYFEKFTISNELALIMLRYGGYTSNTYYFTAGEVHNAQIVPSYGVQVESAQILQVYEGNANDILGDGTDTKEPTVSFDKTTNTLTLNNATGISTISTTLSTLNIELVGNNSLFLDSNGSIFESSSGEAVTINLKSTGTAKGSLAIETDNTNPSARFKGDNVTLTAVEPLVLLSGDLADNNGTRVYGVNFDLWISGTRVTSANASDIWGDGTDFEFDAKNSILYYRSGGSTSYPILSGLPDLTIKIGSPDDEGDYSKNNIGIIKFGAPQGTTIAATSGNLTISKISDDAETVQKFDIVGSSGEPSLIQGFTTVDYSDFVVMVDGITYSTNTMQLVDAEGNNWNETTTFATSNGIVLSAPSMSSEAISGTDGITLILSDIGTVKYSVDYVDTNETDITDATYDSSNKPTISKPATVTAYVYLNGVTSDISTGKYFGAKQEAFTIAVGDAIQNTSWFTPDIDEDDVVGFEAFTESDCFNEDFKAIDEGTNVVVNASLYAGTNTPYTILNNEQTAIALKFNIGAALNSVFEGSNTYGAVYYETAIQVPEGMKAYVITGIDEEKGTVVTSDVDFIPAGIPVLLENEGEAKAIIHIPYTGSATAPTNNKLNYSNPLSPAKPSATDNWYVIYSNKFVKVTAGTEVRGGKCYLNLNGTPAGTRGFYTIGDGEGTTAIREVKGEKWDDAWFDLQGRRLPAKPTKPGLYLHNGKMVVLHSK